MDAQKKKLMIRVYVVWKRFDISHEYLIEGKRSRRLDQLFVFNI